MVEADTAYRVDLADFLKFMRKIKSIIAINKEGN